MTHVLGSAEFGKYMIQVQQTVVDHSFNVLQFPPSECSKVSGYLGCWHISERTARRKAKVWFPQFQPPWKCCAPGDSSQFVDGFLLYRHSGYAEHRVFEGRRKLQLYKPRAVNR